MVPRFPQAIRMRDQTATRPRLTAHRAPNTLTPMAGTSSESHIGAGAIAAARRRHELWIARAVVVLCLGCSAVVTATLDAVGRAAGQQMLVLIGIVGCYYAWVLWRLKRGDLPAWISWFNVGLELSAVTAGMLVDSTLGPDMALGGVPVFAYALSITITALRLDPRLCLMAGAGASVAHGVVAGMMVASGGVEAPYHHPAFLGVRSLILLLAGVMCALAARAMVQVLVDAVEQAEQRLRVRTAFGAYVAEQVVERVLAGDLQPQTERRQITVLFVDIRGFTRMSEGLDPEVLLGRLNLALEAFSEAVQLEDGIVNKYLGDGMMAIFGAPEAHPDHAAQACRATLRCLKAARELAEDGRFPGLAIGAGMHTGVVVVGDVGGTGHREYTAIGDVVNVASRVESANKELGTTALATRATVEAAGAAFAFRPLPPITVRNRVEPVEVFSIEDGG